MTDLRQAAQQALEALEGADAVDTDMQAAITALRTALAMHQVSDFAQAQEQAEPVAETYIHAYRNQPHPNDFGIPKGHWWKAKQYADALYTTPPQRQWVGLTDKDFLEACQIAERGNYLLALQRIQIKLKERNT